MAHFRAICLSRTALPRFPPRRLHLPSCPTGPLHSNLITQQHARCTPHGEGGQRVMPARATYGTPFKVLMRLLRCPTVCIRRGSERRGEKVGTAAQCATMCGDRQARSLPQTRTHKQSSAPCMLHVAASASAATAFTPAVIIIVTAVDWRQSALRPRLPAPNAFVALQQITCNIVATIESK